VVFNISSDIKPSSIISYIVLANKQCQQIVNHMFLLSIRIQHNKTW